MLRNTNIRICFIILALLALACKKQQKYFEGKIVYEHVYVPKVPGLTPDYLAGLLGNGSEMTYKEGSLVQIYQGASVRNSIYNRDSNKYYFQTVKSDTLYWYSGGRENQQLLSAELKPTEEEVMDYPCDMLVLKAKKPDGTEVSYRYFYNKELIIDPAWSKDLKYANYNVINEKIRSIPLKIIFDNPNYKMVVTAVKIDRKPIDNTAFSLPQGARLKEVNF